MKINRSCETCEFNFGGTCADEGDFGYGGIITDEKKQRKCWGISLNYSIELAESLPEKDNLIYQYDKNVSVKHLIERIETGEWNFKCRGRCQALS